MSPTPVLSRRVLLQAGAAFAGAGCLPAALAQSAGTATAKQVIFLFMWGGPSQLDTFDPKPAAPAEIRGPFAPIATNVPGIELSQHFRHLAQHAEKFCLVRSLTHDDPAHLSSAHTLLTGHLPPVNKSDAEPPSERDSPHLGAVVGRLRQSQDGLPGSVILPWQVLHPAAPGGHAPGQTGGWLGRSAEPMYVTGDPNQPRWSVPALALLDGQSPARLQSRRHLLEVLDQQARGLAGAVPQALQAQQTQAFGLLTSAVVRGAFDLEQESAATRDRYGRNIHGQCVLLARRLIDHDVPFVAVNWHNDGQNFWDTHGNNFPRLERDLIPPADLALSALLTDLAASGKLNETLVVWAGEFGRSPRVNGSAGRDHHPGCFSALLAGGGVRGGQIYGRSDPHAALPADRPASPHDLSATVLHALGVPRDAILRDALQRPHRLYGGDPLAVF
jgi:uncharacterized protein (DUF1501 family)